MATNPKNPVLLKRDAFRKDVLERDGYRCVICGRSEDDTRLDAHHIMERRLFTGESEYGGYFVDNGATLCDDGTKKSCHLQAEMTALSCEQIREAAGIKKVVYPEHLYKDQIYTKWGDPITQNGLRMRGEMFWDNSVQTALREGDALRLYTKYIRHPRTYHLPFKDLNICGMQKNHCFFP